MDYAKLLYAASLTVSRVVAVFAELVRDERARLAAVERGEVT